MEVEEVVSFLGSMFEVAMQISFPILLSTLLIGVLISIVQVATQIQEMTLTFVPKILVLLAVLAISGSWMLETLVGFARHLITSIGQF